MAINPETQYPGKIAQSTPDYPYGAARNITVPGDGTGTPWEAALVNDLFGWQQALLSEAAIVPTGTPEKVGASQYLDAMFGVIAQVFASVANMKAKPLTAGRTVRTNGYFTGGDRGGALYLIKTAAQAATDGDVIDEKGNHTLTNGNVAILISERTNLNYGCAADGTVNDTVALQALDAAGGGLILKGIVRVQADIALVSDYAFEDGGIIAPDSAYTITWSGSIRAGDYKIFDGTFIVTKVHRLTEVRITWFGAISADLDTDMGDTALADANAKAIRQANAMISLGIPNGIYVTPVLRIPTGLFLVDDDDNDGKIIDCVSYATVLGEGWSSVLRPVNSGKAFSMVKCDTDGASNIIIDNFQIYGEASLQTATQHGIDMSPPASPIIYSYIGRNLHIKEMNGNGIRVLGRGMDNSTIEPRLVRDCTLHCLFVAACDRLTVQNGIYRAAKAGNSGALFDSALCKSAIIRDNQFDENNTHGLQVSNTNGRFDINNNRCANNFNGHGMFIDRCNDSQITGNQFEQNGLDGMLIDTCERLQINSNHARSNQRFGIAGGSLTDCQLHDNKCFNNSLSAADTYDGINLQSNSDNNSVQGNVVRGTSHRYGIRIEDSFSDNNLVTNNDLLNSGTSGSFNDNGTGTVTTAGNRL